MHGLRFTGALALVAIAFTSSSEAQEPLPVSQCQMVAEAVPKANFASFAPPAIPAQAEGAAVTITYVGHSTYLIETPGGVSIATDYSGFSGPVAVPPSRR